MTPKDEDGLETPLSYDIWMNTLIAYRDHPSSSGALRQLSEMVLSLIEINQHNPQTIEYLNSRTSQAINQGELTYDED